MSGPYVGCIIDTIKLALGVSGVSGASQGACRDVRLATASSRPDMYAGRLRVPGMALWIHTASKEGTRTCMPPRPPSPGAAGALRAAAVPLGELHAMGAGVSMRLVWPRRTPCCNLAYKLPSAAQRGGGTHLSAPPTGRPRTMCTTWSFWMPAAPRAGYAADGALCGCHCVAWCEIQPRTFLIADVPGGLPLHAWKRSLPSGSRTDSVATGGREDNRCSAAPCHD